MILLPIVFTILHPHVIVPRAIAVCAEIITHKGGSALLTRLTERSKLTIIPIVF